MAPEETSETSPLLSNDSYNNVSKDGTGEAVAALAEGEPQYQGLPEVKKKLKYILPAITIGVSRTLPGSRPQSGCSTWLGLSICSGSDARGSELW